MGTPARSPPEAEMGHPSEVATPRWRSNVTSSVHSKKDFVMSIELVPPFAPHRFMGGLKVCKVDSTGIMSSLGHGLQSDLPGDDSCQVLPQSCAQVEWSASSFLSFK